MIDNRVFDGTKDNVNYRYLYNYDYYKSSILKQHFIDEQLSFSEVNNGYIFPYITGVSSGGVFTEDKVFIDGTGLHYNNNDYYTFANQKVEYSDLKVIYIGYFTPVWGHCITDCLRYLWFLKSKGLMKKFEGYKLVYINTDKELQKNFIQLLHILGIDEKNFLPIKNLTMFKKIVIPDPCFYCNTDMVRVYTREYSNLIGEIKAYAEANIKHNKKYEKVYLSYSNYALDRQIGEENLESFFRNQGFRIVAPEKYSFLEQLEIYCSCKFLVSTVGSCSHNIMFLRENSTAILIPRACFIPEYQFAVDEISDARINYIDATLSVLTSKKLPNAGPFYFYISKQLLEYFDLSDSGKRYIKKSMRKFEFYLRNGISKLNDTESIIQPDFYQSIAYECLRSYWKAKILKNKKISDVLILLWSRAKWFIHKVGTVGLGTMVKKLLKK